MAQTPHPPFPTLPKSGSSYGEHFRTTWYLQTDAAIGRVRDQRIAINLKNACPLQPCDETTALDFACTALALANADAFTSAKNAGELLFCWHGTKATEVSA